MIKRQEGPSFPAKAAFRRWGSQDALRAKVAEYCDGKEQFAPVLELFAQGVSGRLDRRLDLSNTKGFVYLLRTCKNYKLGRTNAVGRRLRELAIQLYAQFGLALYYTQVLEYSLVNALIYTDLIPSIAKKIRTREEREQEFDSFTPRHFETTLGKMILSLSTATPVPPDLEDLLRRALSKRNWLTTQSTRTLSKQHAARTAPVTKNVKFYESYFSVPSVISMAICF